MKSKFQKGTLLDIINFEKYWITKMKKIAHQILRKPFFGRFEVPWIWPQAISKEDWEAVTIPLTGQQTLAGYWKSAPAAKATLVLAHPMGKAAKAFWLRYGHADLFLKNGYNVLIYDANGFGESEGFSFDYPNDVYHAGIYAQKRTPELNVGLIGASFGAAWGLCSLAKDGHPYKIAVFEGAFPTLPEFWKHYPVAHAMLKVSNTLLPKLNQELNPLAKSTQVKYQPPILLMYGEKDIYTPPEFGHRLKVGLDHVTKVEIKIFADAEHTYIYRDFPEQYSECVIPFLKQHFA